MPDDPRAILKVAGVECAEVEELEADLMFPYPGSDQAYGCYDQADADAVILALARLVARLKWQRDECADELGRRLAVDYEYEATKPFAASDVIVDLNRRWGEHNARLDAGAGAGAGSDGTPRPG